MCLILFAYKSHPRYKLVIAANRDEFYNRSTQKAGYWKDHSSILGGRDLEGGGTWMGVNRSGKLSLLTNYRDLQNIKPNAPTRGKLVSDYLMVDPEPSTYLDAIDTLADKYNGYSLLIGSIEDLWYYSNIQRKKYMLGSGIYGLSNRFLDTSWPKVVKGKQNLQEVLKDDVIDPEVLFRLLYDDTMAPNDKLPDTGVGVEMEKMLSPIFIKSSKYGTRCSTVLMVDEFNSMSFLERTYDTKTFDYTTVAYHLKI